MQKRMVSETMKVLYAHPVKDLIIRDGKWYVDRDGWLIGGNRENSTGMVMSKF